MADGVRVDVEVLHEWMWRFCAPTFLSIAASLYSLGWCLPPTTSLSDGLSAAPSSSSFSFFLLIRVKAVDDGMLMRKAQFGGGEAERRAVLREKSRMRKNERAA